MIKDLTRELNSLADPTKAKILSRFFKTGKGEYGEGDTFLGITVPEQRKIAKKYADLDLKDVQKLLENKIHEYRLVALLILVKKFENISHDEVSQKKIVDFYLSNIKFINNWDLVDLSAPNILGNYLIDKNKDKLYNLAKSKNLWSRRISILATFSFLRQEKFSDTLRIAKILISDREDLIHKAVGWMLREMGKRDVSVLEAFLKKNVKEMPRTMLRYAIEKFPEKERQKYLKIK